jgi:hypothetical protein
MCCWSELLQGRYGVGRDGPDGRLSTTCHGTLVFHRVNCFDKCLRLPAYKILFTDDMRIKFGSTLPNDGQEATMSATDTTQLRKECLITTGATAPFPQLISAVLQPESLKKFVDLGFTKLTFQVGTSLDYLHDIKPPSMLGMEMAAFDFNPNGLAQEMKACIQREGESQEGLVITHAGR